MRIVLALSFMLVACGSPQSDRLEPVAIPEAPVEAPRYTGPAPSGTFVRIPVTGNEPWRGAENPRVTMVVFSDFECPFCSRVNPTVEALLERHDDLRVVWRNNPLPFHNAAQPAARLAMEAFEQQGNDGFWAMHDILFENHRTLTNENLIGYAQDQGLEMAGAQQAIFGQKHSEIIERDQALAALSGARGTPGFFLNGIKFMGAQPLANFEEVYSEAARAADFVIENGASPQFVYEAIMQNAVDSPPTAEQERRAAPRPPQPDPAAIYHVPLSGNEPTRGPDTALVTLVLVSDFECPFCSRISPTIDSLLGRYGNDLRVVWMNNPLSFHPNAGPAANAALEVHAQAGDAAFWQYHDAIFANQQNLTPAFLEQTAQQIANISVSQAVQNQAHHATIAAQQALVTRLGARGTPTSFINGRNVRGAQPLQAFVQVIDEEMTRARQEVAGGTPRGPALYQALIQNGARTPQTIQPAAPAPSAGYQIPLPASAPSRGGTNAPVVIQIFSDFECPFCARVLPTLDTLLNQYGNRVRFVWRNYPLSSHPNAFEAAEAAMEVFNQGGDQAFWEYHDILFANQRALTRQDLLRYAAQVSGIDVARFETALNNRTHQARVQADINAVRQTGARIGTPSFFINDQLIRGARPVSEFQAEIDRQLANPTP